MIKYFPDRNHNQECDWIRTPFAILVKFDDLDWKAQEELIEIRADSTLQNEFNYKQLTEFWIQRESEYPTIAKAALLILIAFTACLCETAFSTMLTIKNKHRSCLSENALQTNLRIANIKH